MTNESACLLSDVYFVLIGLNIQQQQSFYGFLSGTTRVSPGWAGTRRNIHPPTILIIIQSLSTCSSTTIHSILPVRRGLNMLYVITSLSSAVFHGGERGSTDSTQSSSSTCFGRESLLISGTGFYGPDILPDTRPPLKETLSTDPNQWPGLILSSSTSGLLMERTLLPLCRLWRQYTRGVQKVRSLTQLRPNSITLSC